MSQTTRTAQCSCGKTFEQILSVKRWIPACCGDPACLKHKKADARRRRPVYAYVRYESREQLLLALRTDVLRVARDAGLGPDCAPTLEEYKRQGRFTAGYVCRILSGKYRSWNRSMQALRLEVAAPKTLRLERDTALLDVRRVARMEGRSTGEAPGIAYYTEHGQYSATAIYTATGATNWPDAMKALELVSPGAQRVKTDAELLDEVRRIARVVKHPKRMPSVKEVRKHGRVSTTTLLNRLTEHRQWDEIAVRAGLEYDEKRKRSKRGGRGTPRLLRSPATEAA